MKIPRRGFFGILAGLAAAPWFGRAPAYCAPLRYQIGHTPWGHEVFVHSGHFRSERAFRREYPKMKVADGFYRKEQKVEFLTDGRVWFRIVDWSIRRNTV